MKPAEIRAKSTEELKALASSLRGDLFKLRVKHYTGQLEKPHSIRLTRADVARVETIMAERARAAR